MSDLADLLERFRRTPEVIALILTGVFGDEIDFTPGPEAWSIRQITRHVADAEMVASFRFRSIAAQDNPPLLVFDEKAWATRLDYASRKPAQSLDHFRRLRADNYELLKDLPAAAFERTAVGSKGPVSLRDLVESHAAHAENHARQIQTAREAYKLTKPKK